MAQRRPIVFKKLFGIDLVKSLLIGERLHDVSGKSYIPTISPETKPERNICFRQNYIYFLLPETKLSAKRLDCRPTNARKKLLDSSARNSLIYILVRPDDVSIPVRVELVETLRQAQGKRTGNSDPRS